MLLDGTIFLNVLECDLGAFTVVLLVSSKMIKVIFVRLDGPGLET